MLSRTGHGRVGAPHPGWAELRHGRRRRAGTVLLSRRAQSRRIT